ETIVFHQLQNQDMQKIVTLLASNLVKRCKQQMDITMEITPGMKKHLVEKYADKKMGARPLRRAIQSVIEDPFAEEILAKRVKQGDKVKVYWKKDHVDFQVSK
ncbi:MAG: ATP-dependent Clp protease ATP-binding subunit, partial [Lachnospiraceae bacterium]|nr:ATP-dependent Clp protease ATP-binding subunit [Lachnospiraceae bacterium]